MCTVLPLERSVFDLLNETAMSPPLLSFFRTIKERNHQLAAYDGASGVIEVSMLTLCKHRPLLYIAGHKRFYEAANGKIRRAEPFVLRLLRVEEYLAGSSRSGIQDRSSEPLNKDSPENAPMVPDYPSDSLIYFRARHRLK
jgi:hypothetical protein